MEPVDTVNTEGADSFSATEEEQILEVVLLGVIQAVVIDEFMWDTINEMNE